MTTTYLPDVAITTIAKEFRKIAEKKVPKAELQKAKNIAKGRFVLGMESPQGTIMFGLRREILEGGAVEPAEVLKSIEAVTADDVQRVAQDLISSERLRLAVIGPFGEGSAERFEKLLG